MMEEGDWETTITSPETERTGSTKLRFPNPAIYQIDKSGVRSRSIQAMNSDHIRYSQERNSDRPRYNQGRNSDHPKYKQQRKIYQRRNPCHSWRSSSLDQSSISCYNELNRTFKSNCDLHFSTGSRSGSVKYSPQHVQEDSHRTIQPPHGDQVDNINFQPPTCSCRLKEQTASSPQNVGNGILIASKNSYSTDV